MSRGKRHQNESGKMKRVNLTVRRFYKSELTVAETGSRGKSLMGIILSIIVLLIISSMIVAAIVILNPDIANFSNKHNSREAITLEEALLGELSAKDFNFHWLPAPRSGGGGGGSESSEDELADQLLFEDAKNINLVTMPPSERRNLIASQSPLQSISVNTNNNNNNRQPQQQQQNFEPNITVLVSNASLLSSIDYQGFKLSPSRRYLLIWTSKKKQYRHSFTAKYFLYDIKLDLISSLSTEQSPMARKTTGEPPNTDNNQPQPQHNQFDQLDSASLYLNDNSDNLGLTRFQLVDWFNSDASNGQQNQASRQSISDSLILIQNNDIYLLNNVTELGTIESGGQIMSPKRMTFTGKQNEIFNGVSDWLYEEEIFGDTQAFQVSPSGSRLAYMSFNDSHVDSMLFPIYADLIIPRIQRIKYPKTGKPNPLVEVHVIENLNDDQNRLDIQLILPEDLQSRQHYINRINWLTNDKLALIWTSRSQNNAHILICSRSLNWKCEKNLQLEADGGWLELFDSLYPLDEENYLALLPKFEGLDVGNFKHLAKVSMIKPNDLVYITSGRKDVLTINRVDSKRSLVYYTSTVINEPGQRQLFVAELVSGAIAAGVGDQNNQLEQQQHQQQQSSSSSSKQSNQTKQLQPGVSVCITCDHYPTECLYNFAQVSPSGNYYIFHCEGPGVPRIELRATRRRRHRLLPSTFDTGRPSKIRRNQRLQTRDDQTDARTKASQFQSIYDQTSQRNKTHGDAHGGRQPLATPSDAKLYNAGSPIAPPPPPTTTANGAIEDIDAAGRTKEEAAVAPLPQAPNNKAQSSENLLWSIEDNSELKRKLEFGKAMPLKMRLKVPIANTNYSADVLLLLPPQLSPTVNFRTIPLAGDSGGGGQQQQQHKQASLRSKRKVGHLKSNDQQQQDQALHTYFTPETIGAYTNQLPAGQQYPLVVDVYAGPGSQKVDYRFNIDFGHYLASSRRTIYAMIDGRGSGYQGTKRLFELYHKFGTVEIQDQIDVTAYLVRELSFIDRTKTAIWGWSYGGYAAAMALAQSNAQALQSYRARLKSSKLPTGSKQQQATEAPPTTTQTTVDGAAATTTTTSPSIAHLISTQAIGSGLGLNAPAATTASQLQGVFECAASVAPVTNWIYYDTAYTERFMSSPWSNELYDLSRVDDHRQPLQPVEQQRSGLSPLPQPLKTIGPNKWAPLNGTVGSLSQLLAASVGNLNQTVVGAAATAAATRASAATSSMDMNDRYRRASLLEHIGNIDRKRFLLIHGTADDNVHFQQSVMLMKQLIQKNVLFETRLYPDQDHGIANRADKLHLGATLSSFFAECFDMAY